MKGREPLSHGVTVRQIRRREGRGARGPLEGAAILRRLQEAIKLGLPVLSASQAGTRLRWTDEDEPPPTS